MSVNESDLPTSRRYRTTTELPAQSVATKTQTSTEIPVGSRRFNIEVGFPQSHVTTGQTDTIEFITGPKGDPGPVGPDEVYIGDEPPTDPAVDLWFDTNALASFAGTPIVALPYDDWPPSDPLPNTLYLRLAP